MKRFDHFGEYMFDLLFSPLKKGRIAANQFYLFFRVIGHEFDDVKTSFFQMREEANVVSASPVMLPVFGQDRDMPRLPEEDVESYRTRLAMKALIAKHAGTRQGILLALAAIGYRSCDIESLVSRDPERWAEFFVRIQLSLDDARPIKMGLIKKVVREVKPGSAKDNYLLEFSASQKIRLRYANQICFFAKFYPLVRNPYRYLDGTWELDGMLLNGYEEETQMDPCPVSAEFRIPIGVNGKVSAAQEFTAAVRQKITTKDQISFLLTEKTVVGNQEMTEFCFSVNAMARGGSLLVDNRNLLDSMWVLDGSRSLDGGESIL